jgi:beta-galactosidase
MVLLSLALPTEGRRRIRLRKPKVTAAKEVIHKSELNTFAPILFGVDSVVMNSPLCTKNEMGMESGTMIYICMLPDVKAPSTLTIGTCHDFAQVFIDDDYVGQLDGSEQEQTIGLPPVHDGQELKILVGGMGRKDAADFVGIAEPAILTADIDGNELTLNIKRWTILTIPDGYDTASKALETVAADSLAPGALEKGKPGYYRFQVVFSRSGNIYLNMGNFGRGQVFVNGNPLGYYSNNSPSLQVLRRYLKRGMNEVVVFDAVGPRQTVLSAQDQPTVGK